MREMLNAIFYVLRSRCQRRLLPKDFPPQKTQGISGLAVALNRRATSEPTQPPLNSALGLLHGRGPRLAVYPPSSGCCNAAHFATALLTVRKASGEKPVEYVTIKMQEVLITFRVDWRLRRR